jgi:hypothetical protein
VGWRPDGPVGRRPCGPVSFEFFIYSGY